MLKWLGSWFLRFIGFQKITKVTIAESVLEDLAFMAKEAHPKEMLAFFAATKGVVKGNLHIDEIQLQAYNASSHSAHFWTHLLPTYTNIVGTVHSHPSSSRRASGADRTLFSRLGLVHAIIGSPYRKNDVTFYNPKGEEIDVTIK